DIEHLSAELQSQPAARAAGSGERAVVADAAAAYGCRSTLRQLAGGVEAFGRDAVWATRSGQHAQGWASDAGGEGEGLAAGDLRAAGTEFRRRRAQSSRDL